MLKKKVGGCLNFCTVQRSSCGALYVVMHDLLVCLCKYGKGELKFSSLTFEDSGMYQCIAENNWGTIYANAELRVVCEYNCTCQKDLSGSAVFKTMKLTML